MVPPTRPDRDILPDLVKPKHYDLFLHNLELEGNWTYQGIVTIEVEVKEATKEISLNTHLLKIHDAKLLETANETNAIK